MKNTILTLTVSIAAFSWAQAAIIVPGADGSDGPLNITENTTIDLSEAVTAVWDTDNSANAGKGVYDSEKWAVVFKYSSVNITEGATLNFSNHASRAPVVWLVSGDVTIAGTVGLTGQSSRNAPLLAEPGPGGFRGGTGYFSPGVRGGSGFGVGGGGNDGGRDGFGGSYGSRGNAGPPSYGNPSLVPLIGGSGGGGNANGANGGRVGGGAGGGAIMVASEGEILLSGVIRANGGVGNGDYWNYNGGAGSGGGIRLVSDSLRGSGLIQAVGGSAQRGRVGGLGRVRIESADSDSSVSVSPDPSVIPLADGATVLLWPPSTAPEVKIVSIGGGEVPADPRASFGTGGPDVALPQTNTAQVVVETTNVEQASQVKVRVTPRDSNNPVIIDAAVETVVSDSPLVIRWTADLPVGVGYSAVQVRVIRP